MVQAVTKVLLTFFQVFRGEISQSLGLKVPKRHEAKMKQEVANREDPMNHIASHYNNQLVFAEYFKSCIIPNLPGPEMCNHENCQNAAFFTDDAKCHWTPYVKDIFQYT